MNKNEKPLSPTLYQMAAFPRSKVSRELRRKLADPATFGLNMFDPDYRYTVCSLYGRSMRLFGYRVIGTEWKNPDNEEVLCMMRIPKQQYDNHEAMIAKFAPERATA